MTKHPHIPELKEPEVPKQSEIYVFDRDAIAAYYKSMPLADGRNRIGQYRAVLPKLEPPVPVGSFYMYDDAEGNWLVCQLVGRGRGWQEDEIARYGPGKKVAALEHLNRLVAPGRAGRNRTAMAKKTDRDTSRSVTPVTVAGTAAVALSPFTLDENIKIFFAGKPAKTERDMSRSIFLVGTPYQYAGLDDKTFTKTLVGFVEQGKKQAEELGSTLYYKILPGLQDARRRFDEHKREPQYRLNGCPGIEAFTRKLGLKPATVRKWRQREKERLFNAEVKLLLGKEEKRHTSKAARPLPRPESETEKGILAEQCLRMTNLLLGPSVEPLAERVKKAIRMAESVMEAVAGGSYTNITSVEAERFAAANRAKPTLKMWREHNLSAGTFKRKYYDDAAGYFVDRYKHAFESSPFKKVLGLVGNPDHADDLAAMAATLRAAAENLALLADVMEPELNSANAAKPEQGVNPGT
ncbi:MAG: hypothetical protein ABR866_02495 [Candidatus Korobacteraceae bacterium]